MKRIELASLISYNEKNPEKYGYLSKKGRIKMNPIKIETFTRFQFASNPTFAPDGQSIAFVVQYADLKDNNYKGDLYLYDCAKDRTVRLTTAGDAKSYVWTSRGTLLFPADRDKKAGRGGKGSGKAGEGAGAAGEAEADGSAGTGGQEEFSTSYYEISPRGDRKSVV